MRRARTLYLGLSSLSLGALAVAAIGSSACTATSAAGELMLEVDTDMALPKDLDSAHIEVLANGQTQYSDDSPLGAGGLKIPATLGIVAGTNPSLPVTIRIVGRKSGQARILHEVVTTVPSSGVRLLRVTLDYLCLGSAAEKSPGVVTNATCSADQTCVAGSCNDKNVPSSTLPDYSPQDVFGGGTGNGDGICFDTAACFASPQIVTVDPGSCSFAYDNGDTTHLNVAVESVTGEGVCAAGGCFVPLDEEAVSGWSPGGPRISLPPGLCASSGKTMPRVAISTSCPAKTPQTPQCGPWSSAGAANGGGVGGSDGGTTGFDSGTPMPDAMPPHDAGFGSDASVGPPDGGGPSGTPTVALKVVASALGFPSGIAASPEGIYFADRKDQPYGYPSYSGVSHNGAIYAVDPATLTWNTTPIATGQYEPMGVAVHAGVVGWMNMGRTDVPPDAGGNYADGEIWIAGAHGAQPARQLEANLGYSSWSLAVGNAGTLYWSDGGHVFSAPSQLPTGQPPVTTVSSPGGVYVALDSKQDQIFWTDWNSPTGPTGTVYSQKLAPGAGPMPIATSQTQPWKIATYLDAQGGGEFVVWSNQNWNGGAQPAIHDSSIVRANLDGSNATVLVHGLSEISKSFTIDGRYAYYVSDNTLWALRLSGGAPIKLAQATMGAWCAIEMAATQGTSGGTVVLWSDTCATSVFAATVTGLP